MNRGLGLCPATSPPGGTAWKTVERNQFVYNHPTAPGTRKGSRMNRVQLVGGTCLHSTRRGLALSALYQRVELHSLISANPFVSPDGPLVSLTYVIMAMGLV